MEEELKASIIHAFEREFATHSVGSIEPTIIPALPLPLNTFTLECTPRSCQCTPTKCIQEIIVLQRGPVIAFVDGNHYDRLETMAQSVIAIAEKRNKHSH